MNALLIDELSTTAFKWLKSLGIKINKKYLINELTTHQDYPAISSLADFLDMGNMDYVVAEADETYIEKFKYPLLAHIKEKDNQGLVPINNSIIWKQKPQLLEAWTGVIVMPGNDAKWETKENTQSAKESFSKFIAYGTLILLLLFNTFFVISYANFWQEKIFVMLSALGIVLAWITLEAELGIQNQFVKQVCGSISPNTGCNGVLKSKQARIFLDISLSDAGLTWFISQYLLLTAASYFPELGFLKVTQFWVSLLGIGVSGWSIYTQKFVIKQWCTLCLSIATLIFIQAVLCIFLINHPINFQGILITAGTFVIMYAVAILPLKYVIDKNKKLGHLHTQVKKWKYDLKIFLALWQQQNEQDTKIWKNELMIGNVNAPLQLMVACNPYCGPCAKAHKKIEQWVQHYAGKIAVSIRFAINADNEEDPKLIATKLILQQLLKNGKNTRFIDDWYKWMNIDQWTLKYPTEDSVDTKGLLQQHANWAKQANIMFTPTLFINGRQLPAKYLLDDIEPLLPQLIDYFEENE